MTQRYQQSLQESHMIASAMQICLVFFTIVTLVSSGFISPIQERGFKPITHRWQTSLEERGFSDLNYFAPETHGFEVGEHSPDLHLPEDHDQHHYEHFEDSVEEHNPTFEVQGLPEEYDTKTEKTVHVHEHHHHYHRHYETLPVSIIKKTVIFKHG